MKRDGVLLLGGGFIGTALARRLTGQGRTVHMISRSARTVQPTGAICHRASLDDIALLAALREQCSTVVHLASTTTPGNSATEPMKEIENIHPTLSLLQQLRTWPDTHMIFLSSGGTVYGNPKGNPVHESASLVPMSFHGAGKVALEGFFNALRSDRHPVTIIRPSNTYGPGQSLRDGFGIVRTALEHMLRRTPIEIWGDGSNVRDYIYIEDVVSAIETCIDTPGAGGTYNVGSGAGHSLLDVLATIQHVCEQPMAITYKPARNIDVRKVVLDITSIEAALKWKPRIGLEEGIRRTWSWLEKA